MSSTATSDSIGVDIGGSKIAAALVAGDGTVLGRAVRPTPASGQVTDAIVDLIRGLTPQPVPVGLAAPGVVDPSSGVIRSATAILPGWAGTPVAERLRERLGVPVATDNDARAMAYGEARAGAGRGYADALYVSVGTGIGGAIYRDGRVLRGPHLAAGEIAHLLVPATDPTARCGCGRPGHLEAHASGPAIERAYRRLGGAPRKLPEIAQRQYLGDERAVAVIRLAAELTGRALAGLLAAIDGAAIIVGGGVAQIGAAFLDPLAAAFRAEALDPLRNLPVHPAQLGTDAPLIGAALYARERGAA